MDRGPKTERRSFRWSRIILAAPLVLLGMAGQGILAQCETVTLCVNGDGCCPVGCFGSDSDCPGTCPDADSDGYREVACGGTDCNDTNPAISPAATDLCDGVDNDCDPASGDGSEDPQTGTACDGPDSDLCLEGTRFCTAGVIACSDSSSSILDVCNGFDDDCDPASADGSEDPQTGALCDGSDTDLCLEGTRSCTAGTLVCSDVTGSAQDVCNGFDDDCDPTSADGSEDPLSGTACDGADSDLCVEGTRSCTAGTIVCSDSTGSNLDICNGTDDDCDPASADGSEDPLNGTACDGPDTDFCMEGTRSCASGTIVCSDVTGSTVEVCNGLDDDCSGLPDEGCVFCGNGTVDSGEQCDQGASNGATTSCCTTICTVRSSGSTCRSAVSACDVAETCTGASGACPADGFAASTTVCRAAAGVCDVAENCTGTSASCPADSFAPSSTLCRTAAGICDVAENCTGTSASCPANGFASSSTICRAAAGVCDAAESCAGTAASCPADGFAASSTVCRVSAGTCDVAENCTGTAVTCPADGFAASSTVCRAAAGVCDVAENCTGTSSLCPANGFAPSATVCRAAAGTCDVAENCSGTGISCPSDVFRPTSFVCRAAVGICDVAESCTGTSFACPADGFSPSTTLCRPATGICDLSENCTGASSGCPADGFRPSTFVCRSPSGACDAAETCTGTLAVCPSDLPLNCDDADPCTIDSCDAGLGGCVHVALVDAETAAGADGTCDTADDNLPLYGVDGLCGTTDDGTGDNHACPDNCPAAYNQDQADADGDGLGNACDREACAGETRAYVAERGTGELSRVDLQAGARTVVAGGLSGPFGVAVNAAETVAYVTEETSGELSRVTLGTGAVSLVAAGLSGPRGLALDASGTSAYVVEGTSGELSSVNLTTGAITLIASALSGPSDVTLNAAGTRAFVTERTSGEVSRLDIPFTGTITTIASGLDSPEGLDLDVTESSALVAEGGAGRLVRVDLATGAVIAVNQQPAVSLLDPIGLAHRGTEASVILSDDGLSALRAVDLSTGTVQALTAGIFSQPRGLALGRGALVIYLPKDASLTPGSSISLPLKVTDLTGQGVLSADVTLEFNPAVLTATGASLGTLATGCTLTSNLGVPGRATLSVFCNQDLAGAGAIVNLGFIVVGTAGDGSPLRITSALLNEGNPAVCADSGSFITSTPISGRILYYRDSAAAAEPSVKPVQGALVDLTRTVLPGGPLLLTSVTSNSTGNYALPAVPTGADYEVSAFKIADMQAAISNFDAALNAQDVVGLIALTPNQLLAADVSGNGANTSFDSALIARLAVGLISQFPVAIVSGSDWFMTPIPAPAQNQSVTPPNPAAGIPGSIAYRPLASAATGQDFLAGLFGDVSGNWPNQAPLSGPSSPSGATTLEARGTATLASAPTIGGSGARIEVSKLIAMPGQTVRVAITASGAEAAVAMDLVLRYDPSVLAPVRAELGTAASGFALTPNLNTAGQVRLGLFRAQPLGTGGEILGLYFQVVGKPGTQTTLQLSGALDEGRIAASFKAGSVYVRRAR